MSMKPWQDDTDRRKVKYCGKSTTNVVWTGPVLIPLYQHKKVKEILFPVLPNILKSIAFLESSQATHFSPSGYNHI
jgi:hypothetical protein